jgi:hypothetical protein
MDVLWLLVVLVVQPSGEVCHLVKWSTNLFQDAVQECLKQIYECLILQVWMVEKATMSL